MYKLFAFVGSQRGENSNSYNTTKLIFDSIEEKLGVSVDKNIHISKNLNINNCQGCLNCFTKWNKCLTFNDDMKMLEKQMIEADLIIFASPVYLHNVSADMKKFIDRISYWAHISKLVGKIGITVSSSSTNGNSIVSNYLKKVMEYFGIAVIGDVAYMQHKVNSKQLLDNVINHMVLNLKKEIPIKHNDFQEQVFSTYKSMYTNLGKVDPNNIEYKYWLENCYFEYDSFLELFEAKRIKGGD